MESVPGPEGLDPIMDGVRLLSIDFFDTLVWRPVSSPADVFHLLERQARTELGIARPVARIRQSAMVALRRSVARTEPWNSEVTLEEIWHQAARDWSLDRETTQALHRAEVDLEVGLCRPKDATLALVRQAAARGIPYVVVSDTYHSAGTLRRVLETLDVPAPADVVVSADHQRTKSRGDLFPLAFTRMQRLVPDLRLEQVLHVGDNPVSDGTRPGRFGFRTHLVPNALADYLADPFWAEVFAEDGLRSFPPPFRMVVAMMANLERYGAPTDDAAQDGGASGGSVERLGYRVGGLFNLALGQAMVRRLVAEDRSRLVLLSRDGHMPQQFVERWAALRGVEVTTSMLYASRLLLWPLSATDLGDFQDLWWGVDRLDDARRRDFCRSILWWAPDAVVDTVIRELAEFPEAWRTITARAWPRLADGLAAVRTRLAAYLEEHSPVGALHFDLGFHGSSQMRLERALGRPVPFVYAFLSSNNHLGERSPATSVFAAPTTVGRYIAGLNQLLEPFISWPGPSCVALDGRGRPAFEDQPSWGSEGVLAVAELDLGASTFLDDFTLAFGPYARHVEIEPATALHVLQTMWWTSAESDRSIFATIGYGAQATHDHTDFGNPRFWPRQPRRLTTAPSDDDAASVDATGTDSSAAAQVGVPTADVPKESAARSGPPDAAPTAAGDRRTQDGARLVGSGTR